MRSVFDAGKGRASGEPAAGRLPQSIREPPRRPSRSASRASHSRRAPRLARPSRPLSARANAVSRSVFARGFFGFARVPDRANLRAHRGDCARRVHIAVPVARFDADLCANAHAVADSDIDARAYANPDGCIPERMVYL